MNGIKYLLDTNIIIGMYQRNPLVLEIIQTKRIAIDFRRRHQTKLPDSIIAATAKAHRVELLTLDKNLANKL